MDVIKPKDVINGYRFDYPIGHGAFGEVWQGYHEIMKKRAAIKVIEIQNLDKQSLERVKQECEIGGKLYDKVQVVKVDTAFIRDNRFFIVMELMTGGSLDRYLLDHPVPDFDLTLVWALDLCAALETVHTKGIIHRDIKPQNILLNDDAQVKLGDFGISHLPDSQLNTVNQPGTPVYRAPEQEGSDEIDAAADVYSLCAVFFEIWSGRKFANFKNEDADVLREEMDFGLGNRYPSLSLALRRKLTAIILGGLRLRADRSALTELQSTLREIQRAWQSGEDIEEPVPPSFEDKLRAPPLDDSVQEYGRYLVKSKIGQGGMGVVYRAHDPRSKRFVALKALPAHSLDDPDFQARFQREAQIIANLEHAAIVPVHDFGEDHGQPFIVMRLMKGGSLASLLRQQTIDPPQAAEIISRIARGLDKVHREGFIHRDLKPGNILLDEEGRAYLSDFGLAKLLAGSASLSSQRHAMGTPQYMSPEQVTGEESPDRRTDVYALGAVLYHMLAGQPPYEGDSSYTIAWNHVNGPVPRLTAVRPELTFCGAVVAKAMAKDPAERFGSAGELADAFQLAITPGRGLELMALLSRPQTPHTISRETAVPSPDDAVYRPNESRSRFTNTIFESTAKLKRQFKRLPGWVRGGIISLAVVLLFFSLYQVVAETIDRTVTPTITRMPTRVPPTAPPETPTLPPTLAAEPAPNAIIALHGGPNAIWQVGEDLQFIPEDGALPFSATGQKQMFHSNADLITLLLPDRSMFYLDADTSIEFERIAGIGAAVGTAVILHRGRLVVSPTGSTISILAPSGDQAQIDDGLMGVEYQEQTRRFSVDCLQGTCRLRPQEADKIQLAEGESAYLDESGQPISSNSVHSELYMGLVNVLPASTPSPEPTATSTPTPTATPARSVAEFGPEIREIGRSVQGRLIEAVRFGSGDRKYIFIGGLQAGYVPNSVALAEAFIGYFGNTPTAVPDDATIYIIANLSPDSPENPGLLSGRLNVNNVDLNRNWGCRWSPDPIILGQTRPGYGGAAPFSEPETSALVNFIAEQRPAAVIFWTAHRDIAKTSPGACIEKSRVSAPLAQLYGKAAGYYYVNGPVVLADPDLTGDAINFLDDNGVPAIAVLLSSFTTMDWTQNLAGVTAVLNDYEGSSTRPTYPFVNTNAESGSSPANCEPAAERWAALFKQYENSLGCPVSLEIQTNSAFQPYDNGLMIWRQDTQQALVLYSDRTLAAYTVANIEPYDETELHKGAFGYLWLTDPVVAARLGAPLAAEKVADDFVVQDFSQGAILQFSDLPSNYILFTTTNTWLAIEK